MLASKQVFPPQTPHTQSDPITTTSTPLDANTTARLRASIGRLGRQLRPTEAGIAAGLTPTRITVLLHVVREGPMRLAQLADEEGLNPTMLSRIVGKLSDDGLLERSSDVGDRRAAWVKATARGARLAERIRRERTDALNLALEKLTERERASIEHALPALEQLAEALRERPA